MSRGPHPTTLTFFSGKCQNKILSLPTSAYLVNYSITKVIQYFRKEVCVMFVFQSGRTYIYMLFNNTVVSAYSPPGYKPTSASVPFKEFPDCFCYSLHSKASLFSPTGCKHKPASVLPNCPPKHAKCPVVSRLLKSIY